MECEWKVEHSGRTIVGNLYLPDGVKKCPMVIFSHGYNGSGYDFEMTARALNEQGVGAYGYDFCGGSVNSRSSMATKDMTLFTEQEDLQAVLKAVKQRETTDAENIFLFGASQGGLISAVVADACAKDVKGLMLLYPALCIADDWQKRFPNRDDIPDELELWGMTLGHDFFDTVHDYHVFDRIGTFPGKVLIMHGDRDDVVAGAYSEKAFQMYPDAGLEIYPGEGHGFSEEGNKKMTERVVAFVTKTIG